MTRGPSTNNPDLAAGVDRPRRVGPRGRLRVAPAATRRRARSPRADPSVPIAPPGPVRVLAMAPNAEHRARDGSRRRGARRGLRRAAVEGAARDDRSRPRVPHVPPPLHVALATGALEGVGAHAPPRTPRDVPLPRHEGGV